MAKFQRLHGPLRGAFFMEKKLREFYVEIYQTKYSEFIEKGMNNGRIFLIQVE